MSSSTKAQAENKLKIADHLLSTTFAVIKDPKLLISVIDSLYQAMDYAIDSVVEFEKNFKSLEYHGWDSKMDIFRRKIVTKYGLDPKIVDFTIDLKSTLEGHRKSGMEFTKKEKFVISDNDYNLKTLTYEDVKKKYVQAKLYVAQIFKIIDKYGS
ncbi:MAG: hypothetical protein ACP5NV_06280 [Candidatus Woesearchaeota archaeon]